jgi:hypothetical protein
MLEGRRMLSIAWMNRGRGNGFDRFYGEDAAVARQLVDAAIADWDSSLPEVQLKVRISAANLEPKSRRPVTLGVTSGTTVRMDADAAGEGWYFDKDLGDDSEFTNVKGAFAAEGSFDGTDFYSVVAHELGHALGFADYAHPYRERVGRRSVVDVNHSNDADDLMAPVIPNGTRFLISGYDLGHTRAGRRTISVVTPPRRFETGTVATVTVQHGATAVSVAVLGGPSPVGGIAGTGGVWSEAAVRAENEFGVLQQ